jgi:glycosyltransferase involved in cell wall biosynthesis
MNIAWTWKRMVRFANPIPCLWKPKSPNSPVDEMKIVHLNTFDLQGGAAQAAQRLHKGLRAKGQESWVLVKRRSSDDPSILGIMPQEGPESALPAFFLENVIQRHYLNSHLTELNTTIFTLPYAGWDVSVLPSTRTADVINLHWVAGYQSPITLWKLFALGKPVVWTLHDQWPFTGGCHYTAGCKKYKRDCSACPQLDDDPFDLPAAVLGDKLEYFQGAPLTIVTPSLWLGDCARESRLFQNCRIEVIPNSVETDIFFPLAKSEAKRGVGIPPETKTLLFGAVDAEEKRKGFRVLLETVQWCLADPEIRKRAADGFFKILCFGNPSQDLKAAGLPIVNLGYLESPEKIRLAYSAADLFIIPSLEDNLPNTVLESLSCGTPVIGSRVGGIPDVVQDGVNGRLVPPDDPAKLGEAIRSLIFDSAQIERMGQKGRQLIERYFPLPVQATRYLALYQDLVDRFPFHGQVPITISGNLDESEGSFCRLNTDLGPNFKKIYDAVLFKALKEFAPRIHKELQASEADRSARWEQIQVLTRLHRETADTRLSNKLKKFIKRMVSNRFA